MQFTFCKFYLSSCFFRTQYFVQSSQNVLVILLWCHLIVALPFLIGNKQAIISTFLECEPSFYHHRKASNKRAPHTTIKIDVLEVFFIVVFWLLYICSIVGLCLFVGKITQKQQSRFQWNLVEGWDMGQGKKKIWIRGWIQELYFFL